jgi:hypothetical protein
MQKQLQILGRTHPHLGPLPSDGRGRIVLRRSAYPTALETAREGSDCSRSRQTGYVFSVVAACAKERGVYAASASHSPVTLRNSPSARKAQMVKRPEGRAPARLLVGALNTDRTGEGQGEGRFFRHTHPC